MLSNYFFLNFQYNNPIIPTIQIKIPIFAVVFGILLIANPVKVVFDKINVIKPMHKTATVKPTTLSKLGFFIE